MEVVNWKELLYPYEQAVKEMCLKFRCLSEEYKKLGMYSPIESVDGRVKNISSILDKANKKCIHISKIEEEIEDIAGIRIICQFVEDIAKVVVLIRERNGTDLEIIEEKDYVTKTKQSGYRSYHLIVRYPVNTALGKKVIIAEIQIRTMSMNFWATIEHSLKYKYSGNIPFHLQERIKNCAEAAYNLDTEMATIRGEIMEAQKDFLIKSNLVSEILDSIKNLHFTASLPEMDSINKQFFDLYQSGDIEKLYMLNKRLSIMSDLYRAHSS